MFSRKNKIVLALLMGAVMGLVLFVPAQLGRTTGDISIKGAQGGQVETIVVVMDPPYVPDKSFNDDYRCFLLDPKLTQDKFVTRYVVRPDQKHLVHHVILFLIGPEGVANTKATDEAQEGPGWTCFGGPDIGGVSVLPRVLGSWTPGNTGTTFPQGTGKYVKAGSQIIMQVHYNLNGSNKNRIAPDASSVELTVSSSEAKLIPLREQALAAPPEIRCPGPYPTDPNDRCHRDFALKNVQNPRVAQMLHTLCGTKPEDYINRDIGRGDAQDVSCTYRISFDGYALGAGNHMHLRGKEIKIELNPGTPQAQVLLHNPHWDFNYQEGLWFEKSIALKRGDTLRITCIYDNSGPIQGPGGETLEPRYITWGEGTTDEMCLGGVIWVESKPS